MSHFVVLVIGECPDKQLERYHEFECTGDDNEYVKDIDITDELKQEFAEEKVSRLRDQDGKYHDPYDKEFYRELSPEEAAQYNPITGFRHAECEDMRHLQVSTQDWEDERGVRPKVRFVPDGWEVVQVPRAEVESFLEYAEDYHGKDVVPFGTEPDLAGEHKYGYTIVDAENNVVKIVRRTNSYVYEMVHCDGVVYNSPNHRRIGAEGCAAEESTGGETVPGLQETTSACGLLERTEKQGREVFVLQSVRPQEKQGASPPTTAHMVSAGTVQHAPRDVRNSVEGTGGRVCDMRGGSEGGETRGGPPYLGSGSLPQNWEGSGAAVQQLQLNVGPSQGQCGHPACGNTVPHDAHDFQGELIEGTKWDWYQIGGRWTGWLKLKTSHNAVARLGKPGLMTPPAEPGHADQTLFCNIDVEGMRQDAANKAAEEFDRVAPAFAGKTIPSWNELREAHKDNIDAARKLHREDPVYQDMVKLDRDVLFHMGDLRDYFCNGDREAFVDRARKGAIVPFAIVKEGKWYQRGEMGWWGVVTDEQDRDEWGAQVSKLLDELPGETLVTVVDCHI